MLVVILNLLSCSLSQSTSNSILDNSLGTLFNEIPRLIKKTYSTTTKPLDVILKKEIAKTNPEEKVINFSPHVRN